MHIQEVMKDTGLSKKALQYYEDKGLILIHKDDSGYRDYDEECIHKLRQIKILRRLDFSVVEIEKILKHEERETIFNEHFNEIDKRMARCAIQKDFISKLYDELQQEQNPDLFLQIDEEIENDFLLNETVHVEMKKNRLLESLKTVLPIVSPFGAFIGIIMICSRYNRYVFWGFAMFLSSVSFMSYLSHTLGGSKSMMKMMMDDGVYKLKSRVDKGLDKS